MAFLQSGPTREPLFKAPVSVLALIAVLAAAHVARVFAPATMSKHILAQYAFIPLRYSSSGLDHGGVFEPAVRFVSYMLLNADATLLIINCFWLLAFGTIVARRFRPALFFLFFVVCGVAAAATHLLFNWASPSPLIGASGAIAGLMAAGVRMLSIQTLRDGETSNDLLPILSPQVLMFSAVWVGLNLFLGLISVGSAAEANVVVWQARLGGYFVGLFLTGSFDHWARKTDPNPALIA